jgi:CheY-like chemotaxis protein
MAGTTAGPQAPSSLELLRLEAARLAQANRYTAIADVVPGVCSLLQEMLHQRRLAVHLMLPEGMPRVSVDRTLLRQVLLGALEYLIQCAEGATIRIAAQVDGATVRLGMRVEPPGVVQPLPPAEMQKRLTAFAEIANIGGAQVRPVPDGQPGSGFEVVLPVSPQRTVLVVDDNDDVLALFLRYLSFNQYRVVTASTVPDALVLARVEQPYAITLDLMMPGQDGWDLLQILLNRPDTRYIPVIVCSVLDQKELALALGASAFLQKPVSEKGLLTTLKALEQG